MKLLRSDWELDQSTMDPFSRAFRRLNFELSEIADELGDGAENDGDDPASSN
jgi:hypothetical protein